MAERPFTVERAYSAKELTEAYGIGMTTLYAEIKAGRLVARKIGTRTIFLTEDIEAWVKGAPNPRAHDRRLALVTDE